MQSFTEEKFSLDPELEEALTSATDTELGDLAGEAFLKDEWAGIYPDKKGLQLMWWCIDLTTGCCSCDRK